jgi:dienelactone hydrolase
MPTTPPSVREDLTFPSGDEHCAAWLYTPAGESPFPVIVMAHGLGGTKSMRLDAFAERFQASGYAGLVFDYRHFGDSPGRPRQIIDVPKQLEDWNAALRFARTDPRFDPRRIAVWGTSFGGGHAIATAAANPDVAAAIAQCPFTDGIASTLAMPPLASLKITAKAIADAVGARLGREAIYVPVAGRPGETALMVAPDALPGMLALQPPDAEFHNEAAARIALQITRYFPGRRAKDVKVPLLVCICDPDTVAPAGPTQKHVAKAPQAEIKHYAYGHFDIYVGDPFEQVVGDQIAFLRAHIPTN